MGEYMIIRIAIASKARDYIKRLISVIEKDRDFSITIFSDNESLKQAINNKKFDVFMFTHDILGNGISIINVKADLKILLDDGESAITEDIGNSIIIEKYQRISNIKKKIFDCYAEVCGRDSRLERGAFATTIAFYSPIGGAGKTTVSLMSAVKLAANGKRVFYINLEDVSSEKFYLPQGEEKGMSDLMSFLGDDRININLKLQGMLKEKRTGMFYLNAFSSPNDMLDMTSDDVRLLINGIKKTGIFDLIVIDMAIRTDDKAKTVFELSDKIIFVEKNDEISANKLTEFYGQKYILNEYAHKAARIINMDNGLPIVSNTDIRIIGKIGEVKEVTSSRTVDLLSEDSRNDFVLGLFDE